MPVEDILDMHNVDDTQTEAARYNAIIWYHCILWDIKIRLDNLNEVNSRFTWIKLFTQGCHKMAKAGIFKISNGNMVQKLHALFRVEEMFFLFEKG